MSLRRNVIARESLYFVLLFLLGLVCAPLLFYEKATVTSIWDDSTYTVTAFDKYWDDLIRYHELGKVWWKILLPYFAFQSVRALIWSARSFKKETGKSAQK